MFQQVRKPLQIKETSGNRSVTGGSFFVPRAVYVPFGVFAVLELSIIRARFKSWHGKRPRKGHARRQEGDEKRLHSNRCQQALSRLHVEADERFRVCADLRAEQTDNLQIYFYHQLSKCRVYIIVNAAFLPKLSTFSYLSVKCNPVDHKLTDIP